MASERAIVEKLKALPELISKRQIGQPRTFTITESERDLLVARLEGQTCATCKFAYGWPGSVTDTGLCRAPGMHFSVPDRPDFGCSLHEPVAASTPAGERE